MAKNPLLDRMKSIQKSKPIEISFEPKVENHESRRWERYESYKFGTIHINERDHLDCVVLDYNHHGVRIAIKGEYKLPPTVEMHIPELAIKRVGRIVWQHKDRAGVEFIMDE